MRRILPVVLLLALVLLGGFVLFRDSGVRRQSLASSSATGTAGSVLAAPGAGDSAGSGAENDGPSGYSAVELSIDVEAPPESGVAIRVVLGEDSVPAAGVVVSYYPDEPANAVHPAHARWGDRWLGPQDPRRERRFRADSDGVVFVPRPRTSATVRASVPANVPANVMGESGDLHGLLEFTRNQESLVLRLRSDPPLRVRVIGPDGAPVGGIPVALRSRFGGHGRDLVLAESDPETGVARIPHPRTSLRDLGTGSPAVGLALPLSHPVEVPLDAVDHGYMIPDTPLELRLPPTGSVEVLLVDREGEPFPVPAAVRIDSIQEEPGATALLLPGSAVQVVATRGRAVFPHIGLDLPLRVQVNPARSFQPLTRHYVGPKAQGERVTLACVLWERAAMLRGRVIDADGSVLAGAGLEATLCVSPRRTSRLGRSFRESGRLETDEVGEFELVLPDTWPRLGSSQLELTRLDPATGERFLVRADLPDPVLEGENDLGDLRLTARPVLVRGRVVDEAGRSVARAEILVESEPKWPPGDGGRWRAAPDLATWSDEDGRFAVRGRADAGRLALIPDHPDYTLGERVVCEVGDEGVRLELQTSGAIVGRVLLDPGLPHDLLSVAAYRGGTYSGVYSGAVSEDGSYELRGLREGEYLVTLTLGHEEDTAETFEDVLVRPGTTSELPPLDLRGRLRTFTLEVFDSRGEPPARGAVRVRTPGSRGFQTRVRPLIGGRARIATQHPYLDLGVDVPGHRTQVLEGVSGDSRVTLQRAPSIQLVLEHGLPFLDPGERLAVSVDQRGASRPWGTGLSMFDGRGIAETVVEDVGLHDVRVFFWRGTDEGSSTLVSSRIEGTIDVLDTAGHQAFTITLSPRTLAAIDG